MANQVSNNNVNTQTRVSRFDSNKLLPNGEMPTRHGVKGKSSGRVARTDVAPQDTFESAQSTAPATKATQATQTQDYVLTLTAQEATVAESAPAQTTVQSRLPMIRRVDGQEWSHSSLRMQTAEEVVATNTPPPQVPTNTAQTSPAANNIPAPTSANLQFGNTKLDFHSPPRSTQIQTDDSYRAFEWNGQKQFSFTTVESSFVRNVQNAASQNARLNYFRSLFQLSADNANTVLDLGAVSVGATQRGWYAHSLELSFARHAELREEVFRAFGHDSELLEANLRDLDRAFEDNNRDIAMSAVTQMRYERQTVAHAAHLAHPHEPHALANHSDFNHEEFGRNATEMMNQLSQFHLSQVNSGVSFDDAWQAAMNFMNSMFGTTTSVNNLSFNDFFILQTNLFSDNANASEQAAERNRLNSAFNNSAELSAELQAFLIAE